MDTNKTLSFKHLLNADQITPPDIDLINTLALQFKYQPTQFSKPLSNHILATLFFEPSTRTRFSFESAILRCGGNFINLEQGNSSSTSKGESLSDMGRIMSGYADIIVMRHPSAGSVAEFASRATVPVINAGDGPHQHPTQSLVDVATIFDKQKQLSNLHIGIVGDLKHGRTINSLVQLLSYYPNNQFTFISTPDLTTSDTTKNTLRQHNIPFTETSNLKEALPLCDVLYMTRIQKERFQDSQSNSKSSLILTPSLLEKTKENLMIMHPLPRVDEIDPIIDTYPQATYFEQAQNGLYVRMALMTLLNLRD